MSTIPEPILPGRRRRRLHSDEFKANAVATCMHPGMSMAAVAMANGINANLLRRWVRLDEMRRRGVELHGALPAPQQQGARPCASFVPMQLPPLEAAPAMTTARPDIRIELRRGATTINVSWPAEAASDCATCLRELLR